MQMLGVIGWTIDAVANLTLRQVTDAYDAKVLNDWDQTSSIACGIANVSGIMVSYMSKKRVRPRDMTDFHPYRKKKRRGMIVQPEDIGVLRMVGNALMGR